MTTGGRGVRPLGGVACLGGFVCLGGLVGGRRRRGHGTRLRAPPPQLVATESVYCGSAEGSHGERDRVFESIRRWLSQLAWVANAHAAVRARARGVVVPPVVAGHRRRRAPRRGRRHARGAAPAGHRPAVLLGAADVVHLRPRHPRRRPHRAAVEPAPPRRTRRSTGAATPTWPTCGRFSKGRRRRCRATPADPNTRDYPWQEGVAYRLRILAVAGRLAGLGHRLSTGVESVIRDLLAPGDRLGELRGVGRGVRRVRPPADGRAVVGLRGASRRTATCAGRRRCG